MARDNSQMMMAVGGLGAIALGIVLVPFRTLTAASNLAFVFLIFTIVVAELGGRTAGLVTAVVSALSLNFFLTEPYLTLAIDKPDDIIAFVALAVSGLVAAAFGWRRERSAESAGRTHRDLETLARTAESLVAGVTLERVLEDLRRSFRLGGLVLRHADGRLLLAVPPEWATRPAPDIALESRSLLATPEGVHRLGRRGFRLPEGGGRVRLATEREPLTLDLWEGDAEGLSADEHRALGVAIGMLTLTLRRAPGA
jgi:Domain of unknown function (DUF4118)